MWQSRSVVVMAVLALAAFAAAAPLFAADEPARHEVAGAVIMACPQGKMIKIMAAENKEMSFLVVGDAQNVVKTLKKDDKVKLTYTRCPKTDKDTVVKAERVVEPTQ
jgi:hypothetical protein